MRSIPLAMTWEIFERGRWGVLLSALGSLVFPLLIFTALRREGLDLHDPSLLIMHFVLLQVNVFWFGSAVAASQLRMSKLYAYPASTATLVTWRLLPAMALVAIEMAAWTATLNAILHLDWPLWGPTLWAPVALAAVAAAYWLCEKSLWVSASLTAVGAIVGLWFRMHYGSLTGPLTHLWTEVTPTDVLTLTAMGLAAYGVAVFGVGRNRRGEPPYSLGFLDWAGRKLDFEGRQVAPFRSPARAHTWSLWQTKAWVMPGGAAFGMVASLGCWMLASRHADELYEGVFGWGAVLSALAILGALVMGNVGRADVESMSQFLATRPMTDGDLARIILKTTAWSVLTMWAIWLFAVAAVYLALCAVGMAPGAALPAGFSWSYFPSMLVGAWTIASVSASINLAGRPMLFVKLICIVVAGAMAYVLLAKYVLSYEEVTLLDRCLAVVGGCVLLAGALWVFTAATRRGLVGSASVWLGLAAWLGLIAAFIVIQPVSAGKPLTTYVLLVGVIALAVAPLAAAPLALSWNRHR